MEIISYTHKDDYVTKLLYFPCHMQPKATILILHGMAEYTGRYAEFIDFLNENSIDCYTYDHRGHGKDFTVSSLGSSLQGRGHDTYVNDVINISKYIREHKRTKSFFLYGHSFGSLVARNVIQKDSDYSGVIVASTPYYPPFVAAVLTLFIKSMCLFGRHNKKSPFIDNFIFGNKDYQNFEGRTYFDWVSSDNVEVGKYIDDQYCGYTYTRGFYKDIAVLTKHSGSVKRINKTKKTLPIVFLSGSKDPVSNFGKSIDTIEGIYDRLEFVNITSHIYENARHELLHDKCRESVMSDILKFIIDNS